MSTRTIYDEIRAERESHHAKGWTPDHDRRHGSAHLLSLATDYAARRQPVTRENLIKAGSLIVAAIELLDDGGAYLTQMLALNDQPHLQKVRDLAAELDAEAERFRDEYGGYPESRAYNDGRTDAYDDAAERIRHALLEPEAEADA